MFRVWECLHNHCKTKRRPQGLLSVEIEAMRHREFVCCDGFGNRSNLVERRAYVSHIGMPSRPLQSETACPRTADRRNGSTASPGIRLLRRLWSRFRLLHDRCKAKRSPNGLLSVEIKAARRQEVICCVQWRCKAKRSPQGLPSSEPCSARKECMCCSDVGRQFDFD